MSRRVLLYNLASALVACGFLSGAWAQPSSVLGVPCANISALGIDRQMNMRAGLIRIGCGLDQAGPSATTPSKPAKGAPRPSNIPSPNVDTITGPEVFPHVTQSESTVWSSDGMTIVVNYNDSRTAPSNYSGLSVSTDGGQTFTRFDPSPLATGHGTNFGDPILVYNAALATWFAGDLVGRGDCGANGIGLWSSDDAQTWNVGACAHIGADDDRDSMWVDNNPMSPFYGRMYISWNDFIVGGALRVVYSDDGIVWSAPVNLTPGFMRNVQLTGSPDNGTVFVAAMDEGGGGFNTRQNVMFQSGDGGVTWTSVLMGARFAPPGDSACPGNPYFARITPIWRHMGWGQPGVGPAGVVHYVYAGKGVNAGDTGDIYYTQSQDNGTTWSAPIILNTDSAAGGTGVQWMPSLSVTDSGVVRASWYDRRDTDDGLDYEIWGSESTDGGMTWTEYLISDTDTPIPEPEQPDPFVQSCYAGDYNYATSFGETSYVTWTDGRNPVSGHFQQDVEFATVQ